MRIACLQFAPEVGKFEQNVQRAERVLDSTVFTALDWLVLPEMAFTGYNFSSLEEITPFLEPTAAGPSTRWAQESAVRYGCHVTVGYPELASEATGSRYNSTVTVSPDGRVLHNYRKSFLYYTDELWAQEGDEKFFHGQLGDLGFVSLGICMDINPYKFTSPWKEYEFARKAAADNSPLIVLSMAWLTRLSPDELALRPFDPDTETLAYWLERFYPLKQITSEQPMVLVMANRCGHEGEVYYAGTSAVLSIHNGRVRIYDILGKYEERCLVVDTADAPKFALQHSSPAS
ncbi:N-terminal asparagine amidohydrolase-like protein [Patellaria atrata CBS 101060]|uniref:N-terminal asparagine amidohydrolase-like protein n=1 Tax=Patellaria atrata CBS 101060 TaxID=1346257 RepID=A0A9P4VU47_9PEZI|nr:N-terminal asparagine amidohydrolase-like protein [Patellaria atrata CBS 101060]